MKIGHGITHIETTRQVAAVVKWDDDGSQRLYQPSLKKVSREIRRVGHRPGDNMLVTAGERE